MYKFSHKFYKITNFITKHKKFNKQNKNFVYTLIVYAKTLYITLYIVIITLYAILYSVISVYSILSAHLNSNTHFKAKNLANL